MSLLECVSFDGLKYEFSHRRQCHNTCIEKFSPQCGWLDALNVYNNVRKPCYKSCTDMVSPQRLSLSGFLGTFICESFVTMAAFKWFLPCVYPYMSYKMALIWEIIFTITALMCVLSSMFLLVGYGMGIL